jgi:hypothetical protein
MSDDRPASLTALMTRLNQFHPRHEAELTILAHLLKQCGIDDETFDRELQRFKAVTQRLQGHQ